MIKNRSASPACSLDEAPDLYLGYLTPTEIAAQLNAIATAARRCGQSDLAARFEALMERLPTPTDTVSVVEDISAAIDALLPKIRDDDLHAALRKIRGA